MTSKLYKIKQYRIYNINIEFNFKDNSSNCSIKEKFIYENKKCNINFGSAHNDKQVQTTVAWKVEAAEKLKAVKNAPSCPRDVVTDSTVAAESFVTAPQKVARTGDTEVGRRCLNINAPRGRDRGQAMNKFLAMNFQ